MRHLFQSALAIEKQGKEIVVTLENVEKAPKLRDFIGPRTSEGFDTCLVKPYFFQALVIMEGLQRLGFVHGALTMDSFFLD